MDLIERLLREFSSMNYLAKECIGSARRCLEFNSRQYCLLSSPAYGICCPLQGERYAALAECLRNEYIKQLGESPLLRMIRAENDKG